jgi:2-dehydropantoate 2-reductase
VGFGLIGAHLAIRLSAGGVQVRVLVRTPRSDEKLDSLAAWGLDGHHHKVRAPLSFHTTASDLSDCDAVLVCVKSRDTPALAASLAEALPADTPVLSLQNGLENPKVLESQGLRAYGAVVSFNVRRGEGGSDPFGPQEYSQTTSGGLYLAKASLGGESLPVSVVESLRATGLEVQTPVRLAPLVRAKLLINLNNGVCAAAGVSVASSINDRNLRRLYAACIREGLQVFARAGLRVGRLGRLSPWVIARFLPWPDALVKRLAKPLVKIDPRARSSTLVDLELRRPTEIDQLNGEIVRLGAFHGVPTPANRVVTDQVRSLAADSASRDLVHPTARQLWDAVQGRAGAQS